MSDINNKYKSKYKIEAINKESDKNTNNDLSLYLNRDNYKINIKALIDRIKRR